MAIPTQADLTTLGFARLGEPFVPLAAPSVSDTASGTFARLAEPFVVPQGASGNGANMVISPVVLR